MTRGEWMITTILMGFLILVVCSVGAHISYDNCQEKLEAFIMVNEHDGLSDLGLEQLDKLLDQKQ